MRWRFGMLVNKLDRIRKWGPVYWNASFYRATMALLRRRRRAEMYQLLTREIQELSTLDLCCGEGELQRWIRGNPYWGIDKNPIFVQNLKTRGLNVLEGDVLTCPWPPAECLVMTDSLYHFLSDLDALMTKMLDRSFRKIIISEPIENIAASSSRWLSGFAAWFARVDGQSYPTRFTDQNLRALFLKYGFRKIVRVDTNLIGILEKP